MELKRNANSKENIVEENSECVIHLVKKAKKKCANGNVMEWENHNVDHLVLECFHHIMDLECLHLDLENMGHIINTDIMDRLDLECFHHITVSECFHHTMDLECHLLDLKNMDSECLECLRLEDTIEEIHHHLHLLLHQAHHPLQVKMNAKNQENIKENAI